MEGCLERQCWIKELVGSSSVYVSMEHGLCPSRWQEKARHVPGVTTVARRFIAGFYAMEFS